MSYFFMLWSFLLLGASQFEEPEESLSDDIYLPKIKENINQILSLTVFRWALFLKFLKHFHDLYMLIWSFRDGTIFLFERVRFIEAYIIFLSIIFKMNFLELIVVQRDLLRPFLLHLMIRVFFQDWMQFSKVLILSTSSLEGRILFKNSIWIQLLIMTLLLTLLSMLFFSLSLYTSILNYFNLLFLLIVEFT